ncbi:F pilus extension/retraction protein TrbI Inner membrane protein [Legionella santicrucis]|uniref:F pilus extension/retraction protein TrbI Inner membrane protein n=1 Tax=Legionella santicrucis TaxID=45074 RepID=A0A0W0ZCD5_9GAMM|nr:TrbI F-type domain-containing protein [Legionella santicrucis]KTD66470.1 F pilus extension/retraction protein TrbI Inner membrane protein [Legionella santicrucis]
MRGLNHRAVILLVLALNVCVLAGIGYWTGLKPSVVTFDNKLIMKQFVTQVSQKNLKEEQTQALSKKFAQSLKVALEEYTHAHHSIVLKKEHTMGSSNDITEYIAVRVAEKMRGQP